MALFGKEKDIKLFRHFNRELLYHVLSTYVEIFSINSDRTQIDDLYEEATDIHWDSLIIGAFIEQQEGSISSADMGPNKEQITNFIFLRDDLIHHDIKLVAGDAIKWNNKYWEIDTSSEHKLFLNKDPNTNKSDYDSSLETSGWNHTVITSAHLTTASKLGIETEYYGNN